MKYFDHDTDAGKDELIQALRLECGGAAVDAYWTILEAIYRDETDWVFSANRAETKSVSHWLGLGLDTFETYILKMAEVGLFSIEKDGENGYVIHSERAAENIAAYQKRAKAARQNGAKGGRKPKANRTLTKGKPKANQTLTQPKAKEKEKEKFIDTFNNVSINDASDEAAAAEAAPPSAPICPNCSEPLKMKLGKDGFSWECNRCGAIEEPAYGVPRAVIA